MGTSYGGMDARVNTAPRKPRRAALAIGIMAKAPVAGFAKTRLIPLLGAVGAARLHAEMVERTLATCRGVLAGGVTLFVTGDGAERYWHECRQTYALPVVEQQGHSLGDRMHHALGVLLERASAALVVGTDCPALHADHLRQAARSLRGRSMVFIPALDGGYVLVGATERCAPAFSEIAWGTAAVMGQTRDALRALGWHAGKEWAELDALADLDEPADYFDALRAGGVSPIRPQDEAVPSIGLVS